MQLLATTINGGTSYQGVNFRLTSYIDLSSVCGNGVDNCTPIGTSDFPFKGSFHGGGHIISNLYIDDLYDYYPGLLGYISSATIDSLNLVETDVTGNQHVGGVCGISTSSTISHCTNSGKQQVLLRTSHNTKTLGRILPIHIHLTTI